MKITRNLPKTKRVRADSLSIGDAFVEKLGEHASVYVLVSSNPHHFEVLTKRTKLSFFPKVFVDNLSTATLGWLKRGTMVVPVELELIVTLKEN